MFSAPSKVYMMPASSIAKTTTAATSAMVESTPRIRESVCAALVSCYSLLRKIRKHPPLVPGLAIRGRLPSSLASPRNMDVPSSRHCSFLQRVASTGQKNEKDCMSQGRY